MIKLGSIEVHGTSAEQEKGLRARRKFAEEFATKLGIANQEDMTLEQILEMRKLKGWKNPVIEEK